MWTTKLKIAIIEQNIEKIGELVNNLPATTDLKEAQEISHLLKQAAELVDEQRTQMKLSMQRIKKGIEFLNSTTSKDNATLDIKL